MKIMGDLWWLWLLGAVSTFFGAAEIRRGYWLQLQEGRMPKTSFGLDLFLLLISTTCTIFFILAISIEIAGCLFM